MRAGIAYVSEDRRKLGLAMTMPIAANITLASCAISSARSASRTAQEARRPSSYRKRLDIRTPSVRSRSASCRAATSRR